jgi:hypothetical protein
MAEPKNYSNDDRARYASVSTTTASTSLVDRINVANALDGVSGDDMVDQRIGFPRSESLPHLKDVVFPPQVESFLSTNKNKEEKTNKNEFDLVREKNDNSALHQVVRLTQGEKEDLDHDGNDVTTSIPSLLMPSLSLPPLSPGTTGIPTAVVTGKKGTHLASQNIKGATKRVAKHRGHSKHENSMALDNIAFTAKKMSSTGISKGIAGNNRTPEVILVFVVEIVCLHGYFVSPHRLFSFCHTT